MNHRLMKALPLSILLLCTSRPAQAAAPIPVSWGLDNLAQVTNTPPGTRFQTTSLSDAIEFRVAPWA